MKIIGLTPLAAAAARALALLALFSAAPGLSAQPGAWHEVIRGEDGTTVSIDSAALTHTRDSAFVVRTVIRFPEPVALAAGRTVDREIDVEELDCGAGTSRGVVSGLYADTVLVSATELSKTWAPVAANRRMVFDASCAWLLAVAAAFPAAYDLAAVSEQPELDNIGDVNAAVDREFPAGPRARRLSAEVVVRVRVRADGTVDPASVQVVTATNPDFSDAAKRVAAGMHFRPARMGSEAVPVWVTLPVSFHLQRDGTVRPSHVMPGGGGPSPEAPARPGTR